MKKIKIKATVSFGSSCANCGSMLDHRMLAFQTYKGFHCCGECVCLSHHIHDPNKLWEREINNIPFQETHYLKR